MTVPHGSFVSSACIGAGHDRQFAGMAVLPVIPGVPADEELTALLHPEEKKKSTGYALEKPRRSFIYGRIAAKLAMLRVFPDVKAQDINIVNNDMGQPFPEWPGSGYSVSISHSESHAAGLVFPATLPMGIDIEIPDIRNRNIIPSILSHDELEPLSAAKDPLEFLHLLWTAKEAAGKANGQGFRLPPKVYEINSVTFHNKGDILYFLSRFSRLESLRALSTIMDGAVLSVAFPSHPGLAEVVLQLFRGGESVT